MVISQIKKLYISFLTLPALGRAAALPVRFSSGGRLTLDSLKTVYDIICLSVKSFPLRRAPIFEIHLPFLLKL